MSGGKYVMWAQEKN